MACNAIAAGFYARGWVLAADLLWFNLSNKTMDIDYFPSLGYRVAKAPQIRDELAYNNDIANGFNQSSPGRLNGVFASTLEGDTYNSLGRFYFTKKYAGNGNVNIQIIDRYDWDFIDKIGLGEGLNNTLYLAQLIGIATPFYTRINITIPGFVPFDWEYNDTGVTITSGIAGGWEYYVSKNDLRYENKAERWCPTTGSEYNKNRIWRFFVQYRNERIYSFRLGGGYR